MIGYSRATSRMRAYEAQRQEEEMEKTRKAPHKPKGR
jgi:hypothetical protein